jgi:hypothetical protein
MEQATAMLADLNGAVAWVSCWCDDEVGKTSSSSRGYHHLLERLPANMKLSFERLVAA